MQIKDIINITKKSSWFINILIFFSFFAPGICYFYLIKYELFISLDVLKLAIISMVYSIPGFMIINIGLRLSLQKIIEKKFSEALDIEIDTRTTIEKLKRKKLEYFIPIVKKQLYKLLHITDQELFLNQLTASTIYIILYGTIIYHVIKPDTYTKFNLDWFSFNYYSSTLILFTTLLLFSILFKMLKKKK